MKFGLILYLCSLATGNCPEVKVTGYTFKSHYDCAIAGYLVSADHYKNLVDDECYKI